MGLGKRYGGPYSFGLGKRPDRNIYGFGLGKRSSGAADFEAPYDADYFTEEEKRAARPYSFGIGKRGGNSLYSFGLGKRDTSIEENRVPVASVVEGKPVVAVATGKNSIQTRKKKTSLRRKKLDIADLRSPRFFHMTVLREEPYQLAAFRVLMREFNQVFSL